jgi:hypothetical protein
MNATPPLRSLFLSLTLGALAAWAGPRDAAWKSVREASDKGLPKTAIQRLDAIVRDALAEKAYAEAVRGIATRIALEGAIEGGKAEERVVRLQQALTNAPPAMRPVMEVILADWYVSYYQQNRWRFMQRTATAGETAGNDLATWDLPRILAEIGTHFDRALAAAPQLKTIPVAQFDALLEKGTLPDACRPTLYDFVAGEALDYYSSGERVGAQAEDAFVLAAESPVFGTTDEFLRWKVEGADAAASTVKALRLLQELLAFHRDDADPSAFLDADLRRLAFGWDTAVGEAKSARYRAALERFVTAHANHDSMARGCAAWAGVLQAEGNLPAAYAIAGRGLKAFPASTGGSQCFNILRAIEQRSLNLTAERVWNGTASEIVVMYANVTNVHFRLVSADFADRVKGKDAWRNPVQLDHDDQQALLKRKPVRTWNATLPPTPDYRMRTERLTVDVEGLTPGFYFVVASGEPDFRVADNRLAYAGVWVSDLALVVRPRAGMGVVEGFVLSADSGEPVAGVSVGGWKRPRDKRERIAAVTTDANGFFRLTSLADSSYLLLAEYKGQSVGTFDDLWLNRHTPSWPQHRTFFFTDRALYRPGQTIRYKGVCVRNDEPKDDYAALRNEGVTVVFEDPNGKEIARHVSRANAFGSFDGSFTAPRDRVMGAMTIRTSNGPDGFTQVRVEEYKRPKFQVTLDAPAEAARLDAEVAVTGHAKAYTGASIGGAKVAYRVVREVRFPVWWRWCCAWWGPGMDNGSQEITHGVATTAADGAFTVRFTARADPAVSPTSEPTFNFTVHADVTDVSGETRSSERAVNVGFTALQASLTADEWQTVAAPVAITVRTLSLDGEPRPAAGTVKVFRLRQPDKVVRARLSPEKARYNLGGRYMSGAADKDPSDPNSWELAESAAETRFKTDTNGAARVSVSLPPGVYRAMLETRDAFGKAVTARLPLTVIDEQAARFPARQPSFVAATSDSVEPGQPFRAVWGSGYDRGRAFVEIESRGKLLRSFWTAADRTQAVLSQDVDESLRGGFTLRVTFVHENRAYLTSRIIDVPWSNKDLDVTWERFVSKLGPAQQETWTAVVKGKNAQRAAVEMVATLYDASLDAYYPHDWTRAFGVFRRESDNANTSFLNTLMYLQDIASSWRVESRNGRATYRHLPPEIGPQVWFYGHDAYAGGGGMMRKRGAVADLSVAFSTDMDGVPAPCAAPMAATGAVALGDGTRAASEGDPSGSPRSAGAITDLNQVTARKNLNETAFFFPQLLSDSNGVVRIAFTMPEALTEWRFMAFAHDAALRSGFLQDRAVTAKDLMVEPNPPRFVREGDTIEFTVKVTNRSSATQKGEVRLAFADARTLKDVNAELGMRNAEQSFSVPAGESKAFAWRVAIPDGMGFLTYKAVGAAGALSDGEEGWLPVLSRRILVTESLPLPVRGAQTKTFAFDHLLRSAKSDTLQHQSLTLQMVSQPAWYAVMALPYLIEYPHACSEQTFNRLYANALAQHIAVSDPKIRRIFDQWQGTPALDSPLMKNQDLKSVLVEETPWFRQAQDESQARRNVGILFDANRLADERRRTQSQLAEMQYGNGLWPWFPGGHPNEYISLYIATGFGRLRHLGVEVDQAPALKAWEALDEWVEKVYREILRDGHKDDNHLTPTVALYLYGRSFYLKDRKLDRGTREAVDYFFGQARKYWIELGNRQSQAHLALALKRLGDEQTPAAIVASLREHAKVEEETGMYWRDTELSWWWYRAPIETQAMMIEAFAEIASDAKAVEDCQVWLLKQKQTQDWKTTKGTADAIYGLLLRGGNLLASDALVEVWLAGKVVTPAKVEAGTGFYEQRFASGEILPSMGQVTVRKTDTGVSWGSLHWQYLEDVAKVEPYAGTPLRVRKTLFVRENTRKGPELRPLKGALAVGDELVVRVELRTDRDMEYVHLKDQRGSGTEPVNVLSQYRFQDGLAYYESTRDTASHFFIDYLPKGTYVFEYATRIVHRGRYQSGIAEAQCLYAPEFNSHSESFELEVR